MTGARLAQHFVAVVLREACGIAVRNLAEA